MEEAIPQEEPAPWPKKAWFYIWIRPRETIRAIVDSNPERYYLILAALWGISRHFITGLDKEDVELFTIYGAIFIAIVFGGLIGPIAISVKGAFMSLIAEILGGKQEYEFTLAAIAWTQVPRIFTIIFRIPAILNYENNPYMVERFGSYPLPIGFFGILETLFGLWAIVITVICISEVLEFSILKAFITVFFFKALGIGLILIFFNDHENLIPIIFGILGGSS